MSHLKAATIPQGYCSFLLLDRGTVDLVNLGGNFPNFEYSMTESGHSRSDEKIQVF